ncbi:MAG: hypothetical protein ACRDRJ_11845 [Streptosporangiaceae bacterium]
MLGSFQDAEDVTQEVLVRCWCGPGGTSARSTAARRCLPGCTESPRTGA